MNRFLSPAILLLFTPVLAHGATYYVATTGNNTNAGTQSFPFKTIQKCVSIAVPGDTCFVKAGTYYERVTLPQSGTAAQRITIKGERGTNGEWLTTVDGSDLITGWSTAPEVGSGVYKAPNPTWVGPITDLTDEACHMNADGKDIWHINYDLMEGGTDYLRGRTGFQILALSSADALWNGIEALFGSQGSNIYVRFRNGDNPNSKTMRVAPWSYRCRESAAVPDFAAFYIRNKSYITVSNLEIRGASSAVSISGASTGNIVEGNKLRASEYQVQIYDGPVSTTVQNNTIYGNMLGLMTYHGLASGYFFPPLSAARTVSANIYNVNKYVVGQQNGTSVAVGSHMATGTVMSGNEVYDVANGAIFTSGGGTNSMTGNTVHNIFGSCLYWQEMGGTLTIASNLLYECGNIPLRSNSMELTPQLDTLYIYKNRIYNPTENNGVGLWMQLSIATASSVSTPIYVYHNTVIGGVHGFLREGAGAAGLPNALFINNLIQLTQSAVGSVYYGDTAGDFCSNASRLGDWDYNWAFGVMDTCVWKGSHNLNSKSTILNATSLPTSWSLPSGSSASNAGIDISKPFAVGGVTYSPLPGFSPGYFSGSAPSVGAVQDGTVSVSPPNNVRLTVND